MNILIFGDMEGVSGIVHWGQIQAGGPRYEEGRRLYTEELNAAIAGAFSAGAQEVLVIDGHGAGAAGSMGAEAFNSIVPDLIDERCQYVTHHGWGNYLDPLRYGWAGAAFFIGIHGRAGTPRAALSHTIAGTFREIVVNGKPFGEIGLLAALCGQFAVPMIFISGDDAACAEAEELLGDQVWTLAVKESLSYFSARHIPPRRARLMMAEQSARALETMGDARPFVVLGPVEIRLELSSAEKMEDYRRRPGIEIAGERTVISRGADFLEAWAPVAPFPLDG